MTLDELETICWREGLTRPQVDTVLIAAGSYATTQAAAALAALDYQPPPLAVMHLLDVRSKSFTACGATGVNTSTRGDVTCGTCLAGA
jgi:hypothetical protein